MRHSAPSRPARGLRLAAVACALGALAACASAPVPQPQAPRAKVAEEPEVTAEHRAPEPVAAVAEPAPAGLQAALAAFERGDHAAALRAWEEVAAQSPSARERAHALLGMVLLRVLPSSALADPQEAAALVARLEQHVNDGGLRAEFVVELELLRLLAARERELATARDANRALGAELAARENLIRKLRALSVDGG